MQKITPFLWFNDNAEEAVEFYMSVFPRSKLVAVARYNDAGPGPNGGIMTVEFELEGQRFLALNGGPQFQFTEAVSFVVNCKNQEELDRTWEQLLAGGGQPIQCGWLRDRYGLFWQVVPTRFWELLRDGDPEQSRRVMEEMMRMVKFDIRALEDAYAHASP